MFESMTKYFREGMLCLAMASCGTDIQLMKELEEELRKEMN